MGITTCLICNINAKICCGYDDISPKSFLCHDMLRIFQFSLEKVPRKSRNSYYTVTVL